MEIIFFHQLQRIYMRKFRRRYAYPNVIRDTTCLQRRNSPALMTPRAVALSRPRNEETRIRNSENTGHSQKENSFSVITLSAPSLQKIHCSFERKVCKTKSQRKKFKTVLNMLIISIFIMFLYFLFHSRTYLPLRPPRNI